MSRILRRPMFRKGGEVGGGIMTGIRSNFEEGTPRPSERIKEALKKFEEPAFDPVSQLLQQGFGQAQQLAGQAFGQQMNLAQQAPALAGQQIASLTTLGGLGQAQKQAQLSAQQQLGQQQLYQPLTTAQQYGSGIMGLISGYPGGMQSQQVPVPGIAQTAIGAGATLAGIYGGLRGGFS